MRSHIKVFSLSVLFCFGCSDGGNTVNDSASSNDTVVDSGSDTIANTDSDTVLNTGTGTTQQTDTNTELPTDSNIDTDTTEHTDTNTQLPDDSDTTDSPIDESLQVTMQDVIQMGLGSQKVVSVEGTSTSSTVTPSLCLVDAPDFVTLEQAASATLSIFPKTDEFGEFTFKVRVYNGGTCENAEHYNEKAVDLTVTPPTMLMDMFSVLDQNSNITTIAQHNDIVFFGRNDDRTGHALWKTDGTEAGTVLVKTIAPPAVYIDIENITSCGNHVYFSASDENNNSELWTTDGTAAGTVLLKDLNPTGSSTPALFMSIGDECLFVAQNETSDLQLMKTDGTSDGTVLVKDIYPAYTNMDTPRMVAWGDYVYFVADDPLNGQELWRTDGTGAGTQVVTDIAGTSGAGVEAMIVVGEEMYLFVDDSAVWKTDGTLDGTTLVEDGFFNFGFKPPAVLGTDIFFIARTNAGYELWKSDGTTTSIFNEVGIGSANTYPRDLVILGDTLVYTTGHSNGSLWATDGTEAGTIEISKITPHFSNDAYEYYKVNDEKLYFTGVENSTFQVWVSDGTSEGTNAICDIVGHAGQFTPTTMGMMFLANDGSHGIELWKSDGTAGGTAMIKNINETTANASPSYFVNADTFMAFVATDNTGNRTLWRTDGTVQNTIMFSPESIIDVNNLVAQGNTLYFQGQTQSGYALWKSDGTQEGTVLVQSIVDTQSHPILSIIPTTDFVYFSTHNKTYGIELWTSDGTQEGTQLVKDIYPGTQSSYPTFLKLVGDQLYFSANDGINGAELWISDGTENGTQMVKDLNTGASGANPSSMATLDSALFFVALNAIWKTDGTELGTQKIIIPSSVRSAITVFNGKMYFSAGDADDDIELWSSDGTQEGTARLKNINSIESSSPTGFVVAGDTLFFTANNNALWKSDGTEGGTVAIFAQSNSVGDSYHNQNMFSAGGKLFFRGYSEDAGWALWQSDGTLEGSFPLGRFAPGDLYPDRFYEFDNMLFFAGFDSVHGKELWVHQL